MKLDKKADMNMGRNEKAINQSALVRRISFLTIACSTVEANLLNE